MGEWHEGRGGGHHGMFGEARVVSGRGKCWKNMAVGQREEIRADHRSCEQPLDVLRHLSALLILAKGQ